MEIKTYSPSQFDERESLDCLRCGWTGLAGDCGLEVFEELSVHSCPECNQSLIHVSHVLPSETGTEHAEEDSQTARDMRDEATRDQTDRTAASLLTSADVLPEIPSNEILIDWDFEMDPDEGIYIVLRWEDELLWRGVVFWSGLERFEQVAAILEERYGGRLKGIRPTTDAERFLYGDSGENALRVGAINERLEKQNLEWHKGALGKLSPGMEEHADRVKLGFAQKGRTRAFLPGPDSDDARGSEK